MTKQQLLELREASEAVQTAKNALNTALEALSNAQIELAGCRGAYIACVESLQEAQDELHRITEELVSTSTTVTVLEGSGGIDNRC